MKFTLSVAVTYVLWVACTLPSRCIWAQASAPSATDQAVAGNRLRGQFVQPDSASGSDAGNLRAGLLRGQAGDFAGAIKAFQHALAVQPNSAQAHYNLGLALLANGGSIPPWKDALQQFQAAASLQPAYAPAHRMTGVALLELGDAANAIPELKRSVSLDPSSAEAHFDLGRALASTGDLSGAQTEYLSALQRKSPYPDADCALANQFMAQRMSAPAIQHFRAALAAQPDFERAHYGLSQALKADGKTEEAKDELKAASLLLQRQSDAVLSSHLSNESLDRAKQGDMQSAMESGRKAIWLNPANALANFNLGLLLADAGNVAASLHQLRKAISLAPYEVPFYMDLARVQEKAGNPEAAKAARNRAAQIDASDPGLNGAMTMAAAGSDSNTHASAPRESFPFGATSDTADGHFAFANRLSEAGDYLGAIGELRQAILFAPTRSDLRFSLAVAATQISRVDEAEYELRTGLRLTPASVPAHLALGSLLFERKDLAGAAAQFRAALQIQPGNTQAQKLLHECEPHQSQ